MKQSSLSRIAKRTNGDVPTIDLVVGYNKANASPILKLLLPLSQVETAARPRIEQTEKMVRRYEDRLNFRFSRKLQPTGLLVEAADGRERDWTEAEESLA